MATLASKPKVLIVDDLLQNRFILRTMVNKLGYLAVEAASGPESIEILTREWQKGDDVLCVLMDIMMPGMDGWETTRKIRELERAQAEAEASGSSSGGSGGGSGGSSGRDRHVHIVAVTACAADDLAPGPAGSTCLEEAASSGMDDYLPKPITLPLLSRSIEEARERSAGLLRVR